jgi:hypothetical protein
MIWLRLVGRFCGREIVWGRVLSLVVLLRLLWLVGMILLLI